MRPEVTYNLKNVVEELGAKIGNLEIELAQERAMRQAFMERNKELEKEIEVMLNDIDVTPTEHRTVDEQ